jgi:hypothetical protein
MSNRKDIETEIHVKLPDIYELCDEITQQNIVNYLRQLNNIEKKAYSIGKEHLGSSFNLLKSNGYLHWLKKP